MARISATIPILTVNADARPSNYLVNHISWSAPTDAINWSEVRVLRNTSGYPMNVNDGVQIFSESSYSVPIRVTAVHTDAAISGISYSGGGITTSGSQFEYYYAVPQISVVNQYGNSPSGYPSGATTYASGATFDVTRASTFQGGVSDVSVNSPGGGYSVGDIITLSRDDIGYLNSNGGVDDNGASVANLTVIVTSVTAATSGIRSASIVSQPGLQSTTDGVFAYKNIASVATDTSIGSSATFDITRLGNGTTATTSIALRSSGINYKVNDIVRVSGNLIGGRVDTNELGQTNEYHIYDTGANLAATTNPGYGITGTNLRVPKYYYSIFVNYLVNGESLPRWKKLEEVSSYAILDKGTLDTFLGHLPLFYVKDYKGKNNKDLRDFISLFAFHYDVYLTYALGVFNSATISTMDDNLIRLALKQFGFDPNNVVSVSQSRTLLGYIIKMYQTSGSVAGVSEFLEGLTSYGTSIGQPRNLLNDYDTSSFVDSTGLWYPDPTSTVSYSASAPYDSLLDLWDIATLGYASYSNQSGITITNATTNAFDSYLVTVDSTTGLKSGDLIESISGTGTLNAGTVITSVLNNTQFKISTTPTVALNGATLVTSTNMYSNIAWTNGTAGSPTLMTYRLGLKNTITATNYSSTNVIVVKPGIVSVGDTAISSTTVATTGATVNYIPKGTKVTAVNSSTGAVTLSNNISATMATGTSVLFAPTPATDKVGAFSSLMTVSPYSPYAFSFKAQLIGAATSGTGTAGITWYDKNQNIISTSSNSVAAIPGGTTWTTVGVSGVAPPTALYAQPYFSIKSSYRIDALQFEPGLASNALSAVEGNVSVITDLEHNFTVGNTVSLSGYGPPYDGTFPITGVVASTKTVTYTLGAKAIHDNTNTTGPILLANSPAGITMTGASSSGAVITVSSNTGLAVGDAIKMVSGTGAFSATAPTYVTEVISSTQFSVEPIPVTPLSSATIANGFVTYFTPGNNFVPGNNVKIATIAPAGYTGVFTVLTATAGAFVVANTTTALAVASSTGTANILWTDGFAKAAVNDNLASSALIASQSLFEDARTTTVKVLANRRNLILNPSFTTNVLGWSTSTSSATLAVSTAQYIFGLSSGKVDIAATTTTNHYISNIPYIAVTPSTDTSEKVYTASAYVKRTAGAGITYNIQIAWFSGISDTTPVSVSTGESYYKADNTLATAPANVSSSLGWNRLFVTGKAPTSANFAQVRIIRTDAGGGTSTVYVDSVLFEPLSVLKHYFDGSFDGQNYTLSEERLRTNLVPNPSFETNTTGWAGSNVTLSQSSTYSKYGTYSLNGAVTTTGTFRFIDCSQTVLPITSGQIYTASIWVYLPVGNTADITLNLLAFPWNSSGYGTQITLNSQVVIRGVWTRLSGTFTPVNGTAGPATNVLLRVQNNASWAAGQKIYLDGALLEKSAILGEYIDKSNYVVNTDIDSTWEGTPYESVSHLYYNRIFNAGKISSLITGDMYYA